MSDQVAQDTVNSVNFLQMSLMWNIECLVINSFIFFHKNTVSYVSKFEMAFEQAPKSHLLKLINTPNNCS